MLDIIITLIIQATVPQLMKYALVYPEHKKGDEHEIGNYRPILVFPVQSKYLDNTIKHQLMT